MRNRPSRTSSQNPKGGSNHVCFEVDEHQARPIDEMGKRGATVIVKPRIGRTVRMIHFRTEEFNGVLMNSWKTPKGFPH